MKFTPKYPQKAIIELLIVFPNQEKRKNFHGGNRNAAIVMLIGIWSGLTTADIIKTASEPCFFAQFSVRVYKEPSLTLMLTF